jgi:hypothetical protein
MRHQPRAIHTLLTVALAFAALLAKPTGADAPLGFKEAGMTGGSGSVRLTGTEGEAKWEITAVGEDIGGTAERAYFLYAELAGDGGITARLLAQSGGSAGGWAKHGVMLRESTEPGAPMIALQYASAGTNHPNAQLEHLARGQAGTAAAGSGLDRDLKDGPVWLRAQRRGRAYQVLRSEDGERWRLSAEATLPGEASRPVLAGLCASSQSTTVPVTGMLDHVRLSARVIEPWPEGPPRPQAFSGPGRVLLTYDSSPLRRLTGYRIYRREAGQPPSAARLLNSKPTKDTWFTDDGAGQGLPAGKPMIYTVRAVFKDGAGKTQESFDSAEVRVEVLPAARANSSRG